MHPILFKIGPFPVHAYGFMVAIAFLVGTLITLHYAKREGIKAEIILDLVIYVIIAAIFGSRFFYVIGQWDHYRDNILEIFMVQKGGLVFLGGLLLAMLVMVFYARKKAVPLLKLFDICAPGTALGYAIARIGCFLNGCCFGRPTQVPWSVRFPAGSLANAQYGDAPIHPTQIYALLAMLLVFAVMVFLWKRKRYDGQIFIWWLALYAVYRFTVEYFRYCPGEIYWLGINPGQIVALLMLAGSAVLYLALRRQGKAGR